MLAAILLDSERVEYYLVECVLRLLLLYHQSISGPQECGGKSCAQSYHFTATFVELLDRLVELLHGERHSDAAARDELLSLELLQLTSGFRCSCVVEIFMILVCDRTAVCAVG